MPMISDALAVPVRSDIPVVADCLDMHSSADQWLQETILRGLLETEQAMISQIADPRGEAKAERGAQREDVFGESGGVGVVLRGFDFAVVVQQPIQNVSGVPNRGADGLGMERRVAV